VGAKNPLLTAIRSVEQMEQVEQCACRTDTSLLADAEPANQSIIFALNAQDD